MATTRRRRYETRSLGANINTINRCVSLSMVVLTLCVTMVTPETSEVCGGETFRVRCGPDEVIVMDSAEYGRMNQGKCIPKQQDHMGCSNEVLQLADRWCSGRRTCQMIVPNSELDRSNTECFDYLKLYFEARYHCIKVFAEEPAKCMPSSRVSLPANHGYISSQVTDETGCVSMQAPGEIRGKPGQRVKFTLLDFATTVRKRSAGPVYGYIIDRTVQINKTIYGGGQREREIYTSKSSVVEIALSTRSERHQDGDFLIQYEVVGCVDLEPPPEAWYRRRGDNNATIGCNNNENKKWHLRCNGNQWIGVVGNCSVALIGASTEEEDKGILSNFLFYIITGAAGAIVLLVIIIVVACVCHNKKSIKDETRRGVLTPGSPSRGTMATSSRSGVGKYKAVENVNVDELVYNVKSRSTIRFGKDGIKQNKPLRPEPGSALAQVMMLTQPEPANYGHNIDLLDLCVDPQDGATPMDQSVTSLGLPEPPPPPPDQLQSLPHAQYEVVHVKNRPKSILKDGGSLSNSVVNNEPPTPATPPLPTRKEPLTLVSSSESSANNSPVHSPQPVYTPDAIYENQQSVTLTGSNKGSPLVPRRPPRKCDDGKKTNESSRDGSPTSQLPNMAAAALEALLAQEESDKLRRQRTLSKDSAGSDAVLCDIPDDLPPPPAMPESENYYNIDELTRVPREDPTIPILDDELPPPAPPPPALEAPLEPFYSNDPMCEPPSEQAPPPPSECGECYYNNCDCPGDCKAVHV